MHKSMDEMRALVGLMREFKVAAFKSGDLEVTFAPQAYLPMTFGGDMPSDELKTEEQRKREADEILFHSAG